MNIASRVLEKTLGILWITDTELNENFNHFAQINYISNNLMLQKINHFHPSMNVFLTKNFDKHFFVAQITKGTDLKKNLENILKITKDVSDPGREVLIISQDKKLINFLESKRQDINFENLDL